MTLVSVLILFKYALKNAQEGFVSVPSWGKDWKWKDHSSFLERFDAAIESLTVISMSPTAKDHGNTCNDANRS
jgi:hypothetical protein